MARKQLGTAQSAATHLLTRADADARYSTTGVIATGAGAPAGTGTNGNQYWDTTNKRLYVSDGAGWIIMYEPEQTYTPTWTNVTLGTGSVRTGRYQRSNGYVDWAVVLTLGTGGALTGQPTVTLPVTFGINYRYSQAVMLIDSSVNNFRGLHESTNASTTFTPFAIFGAGVTEAANNLSATVPFTWTVNDGIVIQGHAKMNTPYL